MKDTIIYLIRHAENVEENGIRNTNENLQMINEKEIFIKSPCLLKMTFRNNKLVHLKNLII